MIRWLLAAEADKIQDLIFRSAHLREVVGGSQLLNQFCRQAPELVLQALGICDAEVLVADGGGFRIHFADEPSARQFGRALAQIYHEYTGGALTVAEPQPYEVDDFARANEQAQHALLAAKACGRPVSATPQAPYVAFCASCGAGLARDHWAVDKNERPNYICPSCRAKVEAWQEGRSDFIREMVCAIVGDKADQCVWPRQAGDLAGDWEPRGYVAYLIADGNGLGELFGQCCEPEQLKSLSQALSQVLRESLAEPAKDLINRAPKSKKNCAPILPLILGGDDVFVLLPAVYALDFAQRFCRAYEQRMTDKLQEIGVQPKTRPTMSAAVVICKSNYPHTLVHRRGEELLHETKRVVKAQDGYYGSAVHWEVIVGNQLAYDAAQAQSEHFQASLRPYWVDEAGPPENSRLALQRILCQRYALRHLPAGRLAQLEALFEPDELPTTDESNEVERWKRRVEDLILRVSRESQDQVLKQALIALGGDEGSAYWYYLGRRANLSSAPRAHGLPDLLRAWDFALSLEYEREDYDQRED